MKLTFLGAAHEVTGSRFLLQACGKNILVDYGMEQGIDVYENAPLPMTPSEIDCVLLTHAHIDHSGMLPVLYKGGFRGPIYTTAATADLCRIMLLDSAHIQESDAEYKNRKAQRSGSPLVEPIYTQQDALETCTLLRPIPYRETREIFPGITIRMTDECHLLGSAAFEVKISEGEASKTIVFSGDIGNLNQPFLKNQPEYLTKADIVVMESTYGDRSHGFRPDYLAELTQVLQETFDRGGNVVIPSFAVGRTQEMLYFFRQIKQEGRVHGHDHFPVYVDSPLGIEATHIFSENALDCADEETLALIRQGVNPIDFEDLHIAATAEESKLINNEPTPKVIISASGMCDAGRIRHHLKHNLWRPECTVLFVGHQNQGTLGRALLDGCREVKLFGETIAVAARIQQLAGLSGHADNTGLMHWASTFSPLPEHIFVVHGDDETCEIFTRRLQDELGASASAPYNGESWELAPLTLVAEGNHVKLKKPASVPAETEIQRETRKTGAARHREAFGKTHQNTAYAQLHLAVEKLQGLVEKMQGGSPKAQARLTRMIDQIIHRIEKR